MNKLALPSFALCALILSTISLHAQGAAPVNSCPTHITSCGCVINRADTYVVDNDLNASQSNAPNCIEIAASHSILNLKGFVLTGNGTGIGVLIRSSADHSVLAGGDEGASSSPGRIAGNMYEPASAQASVVMWNIAVEDDADYALIGLFKNLGGTIFQQGEGNNIGLLLNNAHGTTATNFDASYNRVAGVVARNSMGLNLSNFSATGSNPSGNVQPVGVMFDSTNDSAIATASMAANHMYGLWLARSSRNVVIDANGTSGNQDTGILIGCGSLQCTGSQRSSDNKIANSGAPGNGKFGIVIQKHSSNNTISITHNDGNGNTDMVDENSHCDSNIWYNNTGTSNQSCIH